MKGAPDGVSRPAVVRRATKRRTKEAADGGPQSMSAGAERERLRQGWARAVRFHLRQQRKREGRPVLELHRKSPGQLG